MLLIAASDPSFVKTSLVHFTFLSLPLSMNMKDNCKSPSRLFQVQRLIMGFERPFSFLLDVGAPEWGFNSPFSFLVDAGSPNYYLVFII